MDNMRKYSLLTIVFLGAALLSVSCVSDAILDETDSTEEKLFSDCYSLNFVVTLDKLGGGIESRAIVDSDPYHITKYENYINLERFRILFFDDNDLFLFESKNRWVKEIESNANFSSWFVSVPFGPFGDDSYGPGQEYDWEGIRARLTDPNRKFKVAILANRPAQLLYPGFMDSELKLENGVFDNDGPYWGPKDTGKRTIFELHHYQYDIIYTDKGKHGDGLSYYDFVMGDIHTTRPTMGSAVHWVNCDDNQKVDIGSLSMRKVLMPSEEHPIPMYGMQEFDPIPAALWKEGTPFDLSNLPSSAFPNVDYNYRSISLLRSCVRLDLRIPKTVKNGQKPTFVTLWYSNIYSRTEPMDTWTPTDQIWKEDHDHDCEWLSILNYGPVVSNTAPGNGTTKEAYQQRMSWFYGAWLEKGWKFETITGSRVTPVAPTADTPYPRIFNTCIQRNKAISCETAYVSDYTDNYHHWVVYTGERNVNDVNTLPNMPSNPYIACFIISWDNSKYYCIPLLNYRENKVSGIFGPHTDDVTKGTWPTAMNTFMNSLPSKRGNELPYPLVRNHIYRFTLTNSNTTTRATEDLEDLSISSEVLQSADINFSEQVELFPTELLPLPRRLSVNQ